VHGADPSQLSWKDASALPNHSAGSHKRELRERPLAGSAILFNRVSIAPLEHTRKSEAVQYATGGIVLARGRTTSGYDPNAIAWVQSHF
jgi:hypothetical protein